MFILGLTTMGESSAALIRDGEVIACAEEERFSRQKHHVGFPYAAVQYCLAEAGITIADVDRITHYWKPWILKHRVGPHTRRAGKGIRSVQGPSATWSRQVRGLYFPMFYMPWKIRREVGASDFKFHYVEHHVSHAGSAFYCSPFDEAAVLTVDGAGEEATVLFAHGQGHD